MMTRERRRRMLREKSAQTLVKWYRRTQGTYFYPLGTTPLDPITLCPCEHPIFVDTTTDGKMHYYSAKILGAYIEESGDYRSPQTREPFSDEQLEKLGRLSGIELLEAREANERRRREELEARELHDFHFNDILAYLESILGVASRLDMRFTEKIISATLRLEALKRSVQNSVFMSVLTERDLRDLERIMMTKIEECLRSTLYYDDFVLRLAKREVPSVFQEAIDAASRAHTVLTADAQAEFTLLVPLMEGEEGEGEDEGAAEDEAPPPPGLLRAPVVVNSDDEEMDVEQEVVEEDEASDARIVYRFDEFVQIVSRLQRRLDRVAALSSLEADRERDGSEIDLALEPEHNPDDPHEHPNVDDLNGGGGGSGEE